MAPRVNTTEVKEIFDTKATDLSAFITSANLIINTNLLTAITDEDLLKEIERWLSAHFASARYQRNRRTEMGPVTFDHQGKWELGLDSTDYGQKVKLLDSSGILANMSKPSIQFEVLGIVED